MNTTTCDVLLIGYEEWENLGLRYLASYLASNNVSVAIQPYSTNKNREVFERVLASKPQVVGFSMIFQRMLGEFNSLIQYLRDNGISAHFTMGGHFPTVASTLVLNTIEGLDSVIRCEGEETLFELLKAVSNGETLKGIEGLTYREHSIVNENVSRPLMRDLDKLPMPIRTGLVFRKRGLGLSSLVASRGCFYDCSFCSIRKFYDEARGSKRRSRSPQNVVAEMKYLHEQYDARIFIFEDDDFLVSTQKHEAWIEQFVSELKAEGLDRKILWRISCRIDDVNPQLLSLMQDAGLASVYLGIESGNEQGLRTFNKRYSVSDIFETIEQLESLDMPYEFGFMILHPDSSFDTIREDIDFLKKLGESGHALVHFTKMLPYAGTAIEKRLKDEGRLIGDLDAPDYNFLDPRIDLLQAFLTQAFHNRNFHREGLVERLRDAKLDTIIVNRFFMDELDSASYQSQIFGLIRECNQQCLEKMGMAINFMRTRDETDILANWWLLDKLAHEENVFESQCGKQLNAIMNTYKAF